VTVWTVDAQPGCDGRAVGRLLAERIGVPLVDTQFAVALAREFGTTVESASTLEAPPSRLVRFGLLLGVSSRVAPELALELRRGERIRSVLERVAREASRSSCVIVGRCAYLSLASHPSAIHARLSAPLEWRVRKLAASACISIHDARREVERAGCERRVAARTFHDCDIDDATLFHLVLETSRLTRDTIVDLLATAGGTSAALQEARQPAAAV
jgi:hypothetical protein